LRTQDEPQTARHPVTLNRVDTLRLLARIGLVVAFVLLAVAQGARVIRQRYRVVRPARFAVVTRQDFSSQILLTGKIEPVRKVVVKSRIPGRVAKVFVNEGDRVRAGQSIAQIESTELERQATQLRGTLGLAQAQLPSALQDSARRRGSLVPGLEQAERSLHRAEQALEGLSAANGDETAARDELARSLDRVQRDLVSLKLSTVQQELQLSALAGARGGLQRLVEQSALLKLAQQQLIVRAPIDGVVIRCATLPGDLVTGGGNPFGGGGELAVIADPSSLVVRALVPEVDVSRLRVGQTATVRLDALRDERLTGRVARIGAAAQEPRGPLAQIGPGDPVWFSVEIALPKADARLRPGMTANVDVAMTKLPRVLTVPRDALTEEKGQWFVQRVTDRKLAERVRDARGGPVKDAAGQIVETPGVRTEKALVHLGAQNDLVTQIKAGVNAGDVILILPAQISRRTFEIR